MNAVRAHVISLLLCAAASAAPAYAYLGGDAQSVEQDGLATRSPLHTVPTVNYDVHEIRMASGTTVREYVAADRVFAISWQGPVVPNLRQLLGEYFDRYASSLAAGSGQALRRHVEVAQADLIVQSSGHAGAFRGRAYVPSLIPEQVAIDALH